jgi:hypothetical protein
VKRLNAQLLKAAAQDSKGGRVVKDGKEMRSRLKIKILRLPIVGAEQGVKL